MSRDALINSAIGIQARKLSNLYRSFLRAGQLVNRNIEAAALLQTKRYALPARRKILIKLMTKCASRLILAGVLPALLAEESLTIGDPGAQLHFHGNVSSKTTILTTLTTRRVIESSRARLFTCYEFFRRHRKCPSGGTFSSIVFGKGAHRGKRERSSATRHHGSQRKSRAETKLRLTNGTIGKH